MDTDYTLASRKDLPQEIRDDVGMIIARYLKLLPEIARYTCKQRKYRQAGTLANSASTLATCATFGRQAGRAGGQTRTNS